MRELVTGVVHGLPVHRVLGVSGGPGGLPGVPMDGAGPAWSAAGGEGGGREPAAPTPQPWLLAGSRQQVLEQLPQGRVSSAASQEHPGWS